MDSRLHARNLLDFIRETPVCKRLPKRSLEPLRNNITRRSPHLPLCGHGGLAGARRATEWARADGRFNDVRKFANAVFGPLCDQMAKVPGVDEAYYRPANASTR